MHDTRSLVERVSAISVVGDPVERERLGLDPGSLKAVLTPLARFEPSPEGLVLTELTAGVSREELAERTGFAIREAPEVRERPPLSEAESATLATLHAAVSHNRTRPLPESLRY